MPHRSAQAQNSANMDVINQRLSSLDRLDRDLAFDASNSAYASQGQQQQLSAARKDFARARTALNEELQVRKELDQAFGPPMDRTAVQQATNKLKALHTTEAEYYRPGASVADPCLNCLKKELARVPLRPNTPAQMADFMTSMFEGGKPNNYCAVSARHAGDTGGTSFGKHQASETSGSLYALLKEFTNQTLDPDAKDLIGNDLKKFNKKHTLYTGDHKVLESHLREVCTDPAMASVQDDFFATNYWDPATRSAGKYGVQSPLGQAMFYDMQIQGADSIASDAMARWNEDHPGKNARKIDPDGVDGPTEEEFLRLVNATRRAYLLDLGEDAAKSVYRPDDYEKLLDPGGPGMNLNQDFTFRGQSFSGLPATNPHVLP